MLDSPRFSAFLGCRRRNRDPAPAIHPRSLQLGPLDLGKSGAHAFDRPRARGEIDPTLTRGWKRCAEAFTQRHASLGVERDHVAWRGTLAAEERLPVIVEVAERRGD